MRFFHNPVACFEPTYKELKQWKNVHWENSDPGFEPTYKELKLNLAGDEDTDANRFEPTYKELKRRVLLFYYRYR